MVVNRTSGQRGANEQHYDGPTLDSDVGPTLDSDVGPTIRTPEDQRRPNVVLLSGLTLYKKHFDIDCLYHRQGNEQKQVAIYSSTPNLKSPSIRTPCLLKKISFNFKIFISFQTGFHIYSAQHFY